MEQKEKPKVEFIPLIKNCTYHHSDESGVCRNCQGTGKYKDGYYMIVGKTAWFVDTIK